LHDVGSGALRQHGNLAFDEPLVQDALEAGAHLVCFSGDKLLGGPQAGILAGRRDLMERLARHPVARVVRLDKSLLAALESTLESYLDDPPGLQARIPLLRLLGRGEEELEDAAGRLAHALRGTLGEGWSLEIVVTTGEVGGGSLPGLSLPSRAVALRHPDWTPDQIARALRRSDPPVVGRIEKDRFLLDVRALLEGDEALAATGARSLCGPPGEVG
jgi:L-seryl-tRNA(Ser) seleniumtransferase